MRFVVYAVSVLFIISLGTGASYAAVYKLKQDDTTCIIINSTLRVAVAYVNNHNKTVVTSWTLGKPGQNATSGFCASKSPNKNWSEMYINVTDVLVGFRFFSQQDGQVSLENISLTVNIVNGSHFINPMTPGPVRFIAKTGLPLSSNTECFVCKSELDLPVKPENETLSDIAELKLTSGTLIQAFNVTNGTFSSKVARCPEDSNGTIPTSVAPFTTSAPPSQPPLLTLTVNSALTDLPCIRLQSRLQLQIPYLRPGMVAMATVFIRKDATVTGDCGDDVNKTAPIEQTMMVNFFNDWILTFFFKRTASDYGLSGLSLVYNVNDAAVFPGATDVGKIFQTNVSSDLVPSKVPSNGYYDCQVVNLTLPGPTVPYSSDKTVIALTGKEFIVQAFRDTSKNSTGFFTGTKKDCLSDQVNNIVPIVVGASLAALVVIVLVAYLIGRRRAAARDGYQSV
ncbi:hypothetical protein BOX15_Mlig005767g1 [Macrostomum lignano]|uniref:Uncharacterized protein n=2 Tax=Macrostomum lignano TaxID=282301 RepID=A0A267H756_9PLAT|nr:hypothetical protein BOX15_Mlig005767g1 [Macrostomum lignano]